MNIIAGYPADIAPAMAKGLLEAMAGVDFRGLTGINYRIGQILRAASPCIVSAREIIAHVETIDNIHIALQSLHYRIGLIRRVIKSHNMTIETLPGGYRMDEDSAEIWDRVGRYSVPYEARQKKPQRALHDNNFGFGKG